MKNNDIIDRFTQKKVLGSSLRILIPLYTTYIVFLLSIFLIFIPQQKKQLLDHKKETIHQLTASVLSLLHEFNLMVRNREITPEEARKEAIHHIRILRYGPEGKDYFWINDMHPFMVMHPFRPDLEGRDLTLLKDAAGNYPFVAMVEKVLKSGGGYVGYQWQWKDIPQKKGPKISYVELFSPWDWVIGTGMYLDDIDREIQLIRQRILNIFGGILVFIIVLSLYITKQVIQVEQNKNLAEDARALEELRLKTLLKLSQMTNESMETLTEFALEEAIRLTQSQIGYLAFLNEDESQLTMHTWSKQTMKQCEINNKILIYNVADTGLWAEAARSRKTMVINDYDGVSDSEKKGYPLGHVKISRVMNVPIFDGDKIVALAGVGNKKEAYNNSDVRQLELMMDGMWKILQRKKSEDDLFKSEERYRLLAENATDAIWILELSDLTFSYVSPAMERLSGYPQSEFVGLDMAARISQKSMDKISSVISEELARESEDVADPNHHRILELEMVQKQGAVIWVEINACLLKDNSGVPDRILGVSRDITQRKNLERKLVQSNTDLRLAQKIAGIGNWSMDPATGARVWSDVVYHIFERDPKLGPYSFAEFEKIYAGKWWKLFDSSIQKAISKGLSYDIELNMVLPSGRVKWVNAICEPEQVPGPKGHFLRGTIQDITARKEMEVRIQQTQKMEALGTLAGGIAHDFNNILSSIFGFTELAKLNSMGDEEAVNNLNQVLDAGLRARELVRHILVFSRKSDIQKELVRIVSLVKECLKFLRASISPAIEIKMDLSQTDSLVLADPTQLHQIIMNLFTNAAYAMKENGGTLEVALKSIDIGGNSGVDFSLLKELTPGKYIHLTVSDTGCGIPKHLLGKIFDPFFTTKAKEEGTGMGLSMVYGIIKEMQGKITVASEPDMGTSFQVLIPEQSSRMENDGIKEAEYLIKGKGRILIVDDEPSIIQWLSQVLKKLGYEVVGADKGMEAIDIFKQNPKGFDLVLTDFRMPGMNGLELSSRLKSERPNIPIVLCTGFSEGVPLETIKAHGISEIVMKPMIASELSRIIKDALTLKEKQVKV